MSNFTKVVLANNIVGLRLNEDTMAALGWKQESEVDRYDPRLVHMVECGEDVGWMGTAELRVELVDESRPFAIYQDYGVERILYLDNTEGEYYE